MDLYSDEKQLVKAISDGEEAAFEYVFKRYSRRLAGFALRYISDEETVQDIVQDCFAVLWEKRSSMARLSVSVSSFLFVMVRNSCLNHLKHEQVVHRYEIEYQAVAQGEERIYHVDFGLDIDHKLLYEELKERIVQVVDNLPDRCREVFLMSRFEGLKNREIAERLHISTTMVERHIAKATKRFADTFRHEYLYDVYIMVLAWCMEPYL